VQEDGKAGGQVHASAVARALDVDKVVKAVSKQLKEKSFRTKERCFELLRELVLVLDGGLQPYLGSFVPDIEKSIDKVCVHTIFFVKAF
jgi:hypothetical protein